MGNGRQRDIESHGGRPGHETPLKEAVSQAVTDDLDEMEEEKRHKKAPPGGGDRLENSSDSSASG